MDFPVEATLHLSCFPDPAAALGVLRSRGFELTELGGGRVRVKGHFLRLRDARPRLEELSGSASLAPPPLTPPPSMSDGVLLVDADVFSYAQRLRAPQLDAIQSQHGVRLKAEPGGESARVWLRGRGSGPALRQLQSLLGDLSQSLRTQDVALSELSPAGAALLGRIRRDGGAEGPVLVTQRGGGVRLVGPSRESYELKQRLLEAKSGQSARRGRSSSLPPGRRAGGGVADGGGAVRRRSLSQDREVQRDRRPKGGWKLLRQILKFSPKRLKMKRKRKE
ncbi:unnamed protein product [Menidia menidia]|uniref:(Atlantic silverside) hypothetical protein n=1 Tax=Menidia menidia TaxID=238744 RepID=A0A8S4AMC3_9TELE|nr:unnamed protein product [Menidia menidia]